MEVLSVYLSKQHPYMPVDFITLLRSLVHEKLTSEQKKIFRVDLARIEKYVLESYDPRGKRSVVFFSSGKDLWEIWDFEFLLPQDIQVSGDIYIKPILDALKNHEKYLCLLVDREKARLFTVHAGVVEEHKGFIDSIVPQKIKSKKDQYGRDDKILRHIENHLEEHLQKVAQATKEFIVGKNVRFIILGGHKTLFSKVKKALPHPINKMVKGEFVTELNIPINEVFLKSKKVALGINKKLPHKHI